MPADYFEYSVLDDGMVQIESYIGPGDAVNVNIPEYVDGKTVTAIAASAFYNDSGLTGTLTIPDSVTSIGYHAFYKCSGLTGRLKLPDSVTSIDEHAFCDCSGFTGILAIPAGVTSIGVAAFEGCGGLTDYDVSVHNTVYKAIDGILFSADGKTLINALEGKTTENYAVPSGVTRIADHAFSRCGGITGSLAIPDSVTGIGMYAFDRCGGFTGSLTIGEGVTSIGARAFYGCSGFTEAHVPDCVIEIGNHALGYVDYAKRIAGFIIYCAAGSAAETYAGENGITAMIE